MKKQNTILPSLSNIIVKCRFIIVIIFLAGIIMSIFTIPKTRINYDFTQYLPTKSEAKQAVTIMNKEFGENGSINLLIKNISIEDTTLLMSELSSTPNVQNVTFDPLKNYKDNCALITVNTKGNVTGDATMAVVANILELTEEHDAYISGTAAGNYYARKTTDGEMLIITIIVAIVALLILIFTSKSFFEIPIFILVFGIAAVINLGTNFLLGSISFITNAIALVLQLTLSIDYSIIFLHRFLEERDKLPLDTGKDKKYRKHAIITSLSKAIPEILSSSLTTIAGLCALMFMQLRIGFDLGFALSKGIIISLITVFLLMPALLYWGGGLIQKTKHRSFVPRVVKPTQKIIKLRKIIVPLFFAITILAGSAQFFNNYSFNTNSNAGIIHADKEIAKVFGNVNAVALLVPSVSYEEETALTDYLLGYEKINGVTAITTTEIMPGIKFTDKMTPSELSAITSLMGIDEAALIPLYYAYAQSVSPADMPPDIKVYAVPFIDMVDFIYRNSKEFNLPPLVNYFLGQLSMAKAQFVSSNYTRIIFNMNAPIESAETFQLIEELKIGLSAFTKEYYLTGESVAIYEMNNAFPKDNLKVILATIGFILLILLITFKSISLPIILVLTIQGSIWLNFAIPSVLGTPILFIGYLVVSAIQMGATIDYAIVLTNRYQEYKKYKDKLTAMPEAVNAVFPTIITSGSILTVAGFVLGIVASEPVTAALGLLLGWGTLISIIMVLLALPQMLLIFDKLIDKTTLKSKKIISDTPIDTIISPDSAQSSIDENSAKNPKSDISKGI